MQKLNIVLISHETKIQKKGRYTMTPKRTIFCFGVIMLCLPPTNISSRENLKASETEEQEYKQDMARIKALEKSFTPGPTNDLENYEKLADGIQDKWSRRNKKNYARLMLKICGPLSSGAFKDDRRYELARKYALSVLEKPEEISIEMELELTGHVVTSMYTANAPKGEDFAQRRKKDVEMRLHAWKRLIDAIDPNWDPNEEILSPNAVGAAMGFEGSVTPESINDPKLRAKYEAAIEENRLKAERYNEQYRLHDWSKRFPKRAEGYIARAYSKPPFNLEELKQYLAKYIVDENTKARILNAVTKNMEEQSQKMPKEPTKDPPANSTQR
jgi:Txe/YoeB family toxin of Txe-Axe toxin-antitoxin module